MAGKVFCNSSISWPQKWSGTTRATILASKASGHFWTPKPLKGTPQDNHFL